MILDMTLTRPNDPDTSASATAMAVFDAFRGLVVDMTGVENLVGDGFDLYVLRVDGDGDVVVCQLDEHGTPQTNATVAIPQAHIARVRVRLGDDA